MATRKSIRFVDHGTCERQPDKYAAFLGFKVLRRSCDPGVYLLRTFKEAADLHSISMPRYPAAVQWLLQSFATEAVFAASYQRSSCRSNSPRRPKRCSPIGLIDMQQWLEAFFSEDAWISANVDGLCSITVQFDIL
jgi:hypothetical protein